MARARGANPIMAAAYESTYGTVPGSGFKKLPFVSADIGEDQALIASDLLGYGRDPQQPARDVINNEGNIVVPIDLRNFGYWLKLLMGAPHEFCPVLRQKIFRSRMPPGKRELNDLSLQSKISVRAAGGLAHLAACAHEDADRLAALRIKRSANKAGFASATPTIGKLFVQFCGQEAH